MDQPTTNLVGDASKVTVHAVTVESEAAAVVGGQVILNVGKNSGVKVGDQFDVMHVTQESKHPATGKLLRRLTSTIGVVKAADADDVSADCTRVSGSGFKTSDMVKAAAQ